MEELEKKVKRLETELVEMKYERKKAKEKINVFGGKSKVAIPVEWDTMDYFPTCITEADKGVKHKCVIVTEDVARDFLRICKMSEMSDKDWVKFVTKENKTYITFIEVAKNSNVYQLIYYPKFMQKHLIEYMTKTKQQIIEDLKPKKCFTHNRKYVYYYFEVNSENLLYVKECFLAADVVLGDVFVLDFNYPWHSGEITKNNIKVIEVLEKEKFEEIYEKE